METTATLSYYAGIQLECGSTIARRLLVALGELCLQSVLARNLAAASVQLEPPATVPLNSVGTLSFPLVAHTELKANVFSKFTRLQSAVGDGGTQYAELRGNVVAGQPVRLLYNGWLCKGETTKFVAPKSAKSKGKQQQLDNVCI
eukprot:557233-Amphidinium_carterae.1